MVKIAVCDDSSDQIELLKEYFGLFEEKYPGKAEVSYFDLGTQLLDITKSTSFDIYIIDMIMPEKNGIEVAHALRERKDKGKILFLTSSKDYVFDAFNVKASDYLLKPISPEKLFEKIHQLIGEIEEESPKTVSVKTSKGAVVIKVADILYIENVERSPAFFLTDGSCVEGIAKRGKFAEVIADFLNDDNFALCGVSIAANLAHVNSFKRDLGIIYLNNGRELFCSRLYAKDFKNALDKFRG